jgi:hypothetical protein
MRDDSCTLQCATYSMVHLKNNYDFQTSIYQYYLQLVQDRIDVFRDMIAYRGL